MLDVGGLGSKWGASSGEKLMTRKRQDWLVRGMVFTVTGGDIGTAITASCAPYNWEVGGHVVQ
jgi:hypothetical protein